MSSSRSDCLFVIIPELFTEKNGYELGVIWPGIEGIHGTEYYCGFDYDLATEWVNGLNYKNGHTPWFAARALEMASGLNKIHFYNA